MNRDRDLEGPDGALHRDQRLLLDVLDLAVGGT